MKFIHTADLHLDSPLRGLSAYDDAPAEQLRTATRDAFQNLVRLAIEEAVDFMVIAGDIYDGDWQDFNTGLFFVRQMGELKKAGIPVYLLHGNHDAESRMTKSLVLPDNVHVFRSGKAETIRLERLRVALHGQSFSKPETTENLVSGYPDPVAGWFNIGVLHTALEGNAAHARYAPCSVAELEARGYQYWALGHVHEYWLKEGDVSVAFPGNIQGRHIREPGARGALLISVDDTQITHIRRVEVDVLRWQQLDITLSDTDDMTGAIRAAGRALEALLSETPSHLPLAVRVVFRGETPAHEVLKAHAVQLRHEVIAQAVAQDAGRLWIEKVIVDTTAPAADALATDASIQDTLDDLHELMREAPNDPEFIASLTADWQALLDKLPPEVRKASDDERLSSVQNGEHIARRLQEAIPLLMNQVASAHRKTH